MVDKKGRRAKAWRPLSWMVCTALHYKAALLSKLTFAAKATSRASVCEMTGCPYPDRCNTHGH